MDDLDHQSEGTKRMSEESHPPLVDKADVREEPVKRKRGRPKLAEGEKGNYRLSAKERARRASAAAVRNADRAKKKAQKKAQRKVQRKVQKRRAQRRRAQRNQTKKSRIHGKALKIKNNILELKLLITIQIKLRMKQMNTKKTTTVILCMTKLK